MHTHSFFKQILFVVSILLLASCDKDYNEIGADLINQNNLEFIDETFDVVAYNQKIGPIQSDNLSVNPLGVYNNPAFGQTIANYATQVELASVNPNINTALNQEIVSVILNIPYFVSKKDPKTEGGFTYVLESIYGNATSPKFKLGIYESGYTFSPRDPNNELLTAQNFYTNQNTFFDNLKGIRLNDDVDKSQNDEFFFDNAQHVIAPKTVTDPPQPNSYLAPSMRLSLNKTFFLENILHASPDKLISNVNFKDYFKGLYFKVEKLDGNDGRLAMLDFSKGTITIQFKENTSTTVATRIDRTIVLNLTGKKVSLLEQSNLNSDYETAFNNPNTITGDNKLYLKGGEGSMAVIKKIFGEIDNFGVDGETGEKNGVSDKLDKIRKSNRLINEANLVFHIDAANEKFINSPEPQRIYLYDLTNNSVIADYSISNLNIYDGKLFKESSESERGSYYKIRITNHIRNLIQKNSTAKDVELGVVVTEDINNFTSNKFKDQTGTIKEAPAASVMNPLGTILYGTGANVAADKKLKLVISYTKLK